MGYTNPVRNLDDIARTCPTCGLTVLSATGGNECVHCERFIVLAELALLAGNIAATTATASSGLLWSTLSADELEKVDARLSHLRQRIEHLTPRD